MSQLPRILDHLDRWGSQEVTFVRPTAGNGLTILNTIATTDSPASCVMSIRKLTVSRSTAIPFHVHPKREKIYIYLSKDSYTSVLVKIEGAMQTFALHHPLDHLVIPPGCPHAIVHAAVSDGEILVITSSNDPDDIAWEDGIEELLKNEHQTAQ